MTAKIKQQMEDEQAKLTEVVLPQGVTLPPLGIRDVRLETITPRLSDAQAQRKQNALVTIQNLQLQLQTAIQAYNGL